MLSSLLSFLLLNSFIFDINLHALGGTVTFTIAPSSTDPQISNGWGNNLVMYDESTLDTNEPKRLMYLPGTNGKASAAENFLQQGVDAGYLVLGVAYVNDVPMGEYCRPSGASINCYWNTRRNIIQGQYYEGSGRNVSRADSIVNRLYSLMEYVRDSCTQCGTLARQYVTNFFTVELPYLPPMYGSGMNWTAITVSGHSQGAGHVTAMGYLYNVSRVVALSGCTDFPVYDDYRWTWAYSSSKNTTASSFFGLVAYNEEAAQKIVDNWDGTPMQGKPADVPVSNGNNDASYGFSHQLCSTLPNNCFFAHGSTGNDNALANTWRYMLTVDPEIAYLNPFLCDIDPCNKSIETIILICIVVLMAVLPTVSIFFQDYCYYKFRISGQPHRSYFFAILIFTFLLGGGLGFLLFWLYRFQNNWPLIADVIKAAVGVFVAICVSTSASLWAIKRYYPPSSDETIEDRLLSLSPAMQIKDNR